MHFTYCLIKIITLLQILIGKDANSLSATLHLCGKRFCILSENQNSTQEVVKLFEKFNM